MTEKELNNLRKNYYEVLSNEYELNELKREVEKLENIPEVQKYISLTERIKTVEKTDYTNLALIVAGDIAKKTEHSNKIYVKIGNYVIDDEEKKTYSLTSFLRSTHRKYIDLETETEIYVSSENLIKFINNNITIDMSDIFPDFNLGKKDTETAYNVAFLKLRRMYIESLLKNSQEEALSELLDPEKKVKSFVKTTTDYIHRK